VYILTAIKKTTPSLTYGIRRPGLYKDMPPPPHFHTSTEKGVHKTTATSKKRNTAAE
jgi:hypothetical protein